MRIILPLLFLSLSTVIYGQVHQPDRYEIELDMFEEGYNVLSGDDNGVILYKPMDVYQAGNELWKFIKLDTALNEEWVKEYYFDRDYIFTGYDYHAQKFSFLFQLSTQGARDLLLIQVDQVTGDTVQHMIKNLVTIQLEIFEMTDEAALIGGYFNEDPVVLYYNLMDRKLKVLPGIFGERTELVQVKVEDELIKVLVSARTVNKSNTIAIKSYDKEGNYLDNYVFSPDEDLGLIFGRVADLGNEGTLIVGTYGARRSEYSRGLFIAQHNAEEEQIMKYFNFADLDNFFTYLKAKRQTRISNKITRKKIKGKKVKFNYRLLVHEIVKTGDNYVMLGEAFYPKYSSTGTYSGYSQYSGNNSGSYMPSTFAGYRYTHAVIIGFDKNGQKLWDNSFQIEDVLTYELNQYVHADVSNDKLVLFYLYNHEIRTKIISGGEVLEGKSFDSVKLMFEDDVVNKNNISNIGGLEKWYGHNFLAYGVQKIKNLRDTGVKLNRKVFYINKVLYGNTQPTTTELSELP
jgi:hypothetical protein